MPARAAPSSSGLRPPPGRTIARPRGWAWPARAPERRGTTPLQEPVQLPHEVALLFSLVASSIHQPERQKSREHNPVALKRVAQTLLRLQHGKPGVKDDVLVRLAQKRLPAQEHVFFHACGLMCNHNAVCVSARRG